MGFLFAELSVSSIAGICICALLASLLLLSLYRLTLHPLSSYPGPPLWSISALPLAYHTVLGTLSHKTASLHAIYGPVVRLSPEELSYIGEDAFPDIYGRKFELAKDLNRLVVVEEENVRGMLSASDEAHARMRRNLSSGFSEKALRDQEYIIMKYVDLLMQRLHENSENGPVDMAKWFNFATFDIIGDLTFGESFGCLEKSELHFWVQMIFNALKSMAILGLTKRYSPLDRIILALLPESVRKEQRAHGALLKAKVEKRLESQDPRPDFLSQTQKLLNTPSGMVMPELLPTASTLVIAGSETTATLLSGITYFLCTNPSTFSKLKAEVRSAFRSESDITITSVNSLTYMLACLSEALRIGPPSPATFHRVTPVSGCEIAGRFVPGNTSVGINHWSAFRSPANFERADEYLPERWLGEEWEGDRRKACQPFSVGRRNCIGMNLAYAEMRVILARLVWGFDMELAEGSEGWFGELRVWLTYEKVPLMVKLRPVVRD